MIAACCICGELLTGKTTAEEVIIAVTVEQKAAAEIMDFDKLAATVVNHLTQRHRREGLELAQCANLAAKVYAMTHVQSSEEKFAQLRAAWREGIMQMLFPAAYADGAATFADSSSPLPPSVS